MLSMSWRLYTEGFAIQTAPGKWNENILKGMDFVMAQARLRGRCLHPSTFQLTTRYDPLYFKKLGGKSH